MPLDSKVRVWWHFVTASICTKEIWTVSCFCWMWWCGSHPSIPMFDLNFIPWMFGEPAWKHLPSASVFVYQLCHCSGCFNLSCPCWFMSWENWESGSYSLCSQFRRFGHLLSFCTFCPVNLWGTWETFHVWSVALARNIAMKYKSCARDM